MKYKRINIFIMSFIFASLLITNSYSQYRYTKTPHDAEGPYYPVSRRSDEDNNLINVKGMSESAKGDVLDLTGVVINTNGIPQKDVTVEIWQTDANGLYRHTRDRSIGKRDPFFQYWGKTKTDEEGKYSFKTLIPGEYNPRPSHIHFKVWVGRKVILTSQMYIIKNKTNTSHINEPLNLYVTKNKKGEYSGFFRIVY